jgi:hypothetical protein
VKVQRSVGFVKILTTAYTSFLQKVDNKHSINMVYTYSTCHHYALFYTNKFLARGINVFIKNAKDVGSLPLRDLVALNVGATAHHVPTPPGTTQLSFTVLLLL